MSRQRSSISRLITGLMLVEAATLAIASIVHFGVVIPLGVVTLDDPFAGARIPEAIIAVVVGVAAISRLTGWSGAWWLALGATLFAIAGVVVGIRFVLIGMDSPAGDLIYHFSLLVALLVTVGLLFTPAARYPARI
jgi:hypothetical protein